MAKKKLNSHDVLRKAKSEGWINNKGRLTFGELEGAKFIGVIVFVRNSSWDWPAFLDHMYGYWGLGPKEVLDIFEDGTATMYPSEDGVLIGILETLCPNTEPDAIMEALEFST